MRKTRSSQANSPTTTGSDASAFATTLAAGSAGQQAAANMQRHSAGGFATATDDTDDDVDAGSRLLRGVSGSNHGPHSHWASAPSRAATAVLHAPLGDALELTHAYQERTDHDEQHSGLPCVKDASAGPTLRDEMPNMVLLVILCTLTLRRRLCGFQWH
jgi:hypothetical protein